MWPDTRLIDLLGIDLPIIQAPMAGSTTPALAAAVSEAGGLGSLGCAMLSPEDVALRFFGHVRSWSHSELARLTQIDYDREMAFVAVRPSDDGRQIMGVVRGITDPDNERCEYAIVVRSDYKGRGLGYALMQKLLRYLRDKGTATVVGRVRADNHRMIEMVRTLGFEARRGEDSREVEVSLRLGGA